LKGAEPGRRPGERLFSLMLDPRVQKTEIFWSHTIKIL
jgi:hypothetical protein